LARQICEALKKDLLVFIAWAVSYLFNNTGLFKKNSERSKAYYSITKYNINI